MNQAHLDTKVEMAEIGQIILNSISRAPAHWRCFTLFCNIVTTSNFEDDGLAKRLPAMAAKLWPEYVFAGNTKDLMAWSFGSMNHGKPNEVLSRAFKQEFPEQFALAYQMLAEYELARIAIAKRELKSQLYLARSEKSWHEAVRHTHSSFLLKRLNRFRFCSDVSIDYEQKVWELRVISAMYLAGCDPEQAIGKLDHLFARPVSFQYQESQGRTALIWLAILVKNQAWLLSDYPESVTFYREFVQRMNKM